MSFLLGFKLFRFRRRHKKILAVYDAFNESPKRTMHPYEIGRWAGLHSMDVIDVMQSTPELFLKVPGKEDVGAFYALRPSVVAQGEESVTDFIRKCARRDALLYYSCWIVFGIFLIVLFIHFLPEIRMMFGSY